MCRKIITWIGLFLCVPSLCMAFDLYVHSVKAPLFSSPSLGGEPAAEVAKGARLEGISERDAWYQVDYQGKPLWIYKLMAGKTPPLAGGTADDARIDRMSGQARRRPSAFAGTAAARGLVDNRRRFGSGHALDYDALERMESFYPSDGAVEAFISQGEAY